jgi:hypothetical protein
MTLRKLFCACCILPGAALLFPFSPHAHPEMAGPHSVFVGAQAVALSFTEGFIFDSQEFSADYVFPIIPLSLGAFMKLPRPNLKSFGARAAFHINTGDPKTDLYALYVFDFGFLRNDLLAQYNDETQSVYWYDFRAGARRLIGKFFCLTLETGFKLRDISLGLSIKLN